MDKHAIGVFDSGLGGLTCLNECKKLLPNEHFIYIADNKNMPYGQKSSTIITQLTMNAVQKFAHKKIKALVLACNTATAAAGASLREALGIRVLGIEPAIKPASKSVGKVLVLVTQATAQQERFKKLLSMYGNDNTMILPQQELARQIEENIFDLKKLECDLKKMFAPHQDATGIVLGCTHYIFIKKLILNCFANKPEIYDGNTGVAAYLASCLKAEGKECCTNKGKTQIITTLPHTQEKYQRVLKMLEDGCF